MRPPWTASTPVQKDGWRWRTRMENWREISSVLAVLCPAKDFYFSLLLPGFFFCFWCSVLKLQSYLHSSSSQSLALFLFLVSQNLTFFSLFWAPLLKIVSSLLVESCVLLPHLPSIFQHFQFLLLSVCSLAFLKSHLEPPCCLIFYLSAKEEKSIFSELFIPV